jgi:molybdopterin converting factor small subunit
MAAYASMDFVGAWQWGPLACLPLVLLFAEPIEGKAQSWVAPGQARTAWVTAWYTDLNVRRFGTIDQLLEKLIESENKQYDVEDWLRDLREDGVVNEAHNRQSKPFDTVLSDDDPALDRDDEPSTAAAGGDD